MLESNSGSKWAGEIGGFFWERFWIVWGEMSASCEGVS